MRIDVRHNDVEQALRRLKKLLNREGIFREMRQREFHEKPFEKRQRKEREAQKRIRKSEWKRHHDM